LFRRKRHKKRQPHSTLYQTGKTKDIKDAREQTR
jgi:hypothetical protein